MLVSFVSDICIHRSTKLIAIFPRKLNFYSTASNTRNIAIIAHVDHGKTTLVDGLLRQSGSLDQGDVNARVMDSNVLEKERGITILAKCTSINWKGVNLNIVDTPGHADFGGEVERALTMVDGVILVVDATEGPMPQTKFVLSKALKLNLIPIVVQNKVDRPSSRCDDVDCEVLDLFMELNASDRQLDFSTVYASAKHGWAVDYNPTGKSLPESLLNLHSLLDLIVAKIPAPKVDASKPFSMLVNSVEPNAFVGKCLLGKVSSGSARIGDDIKSIAPDGSVTERNRITRMFVRRGIVQCDVSEAHAGDIVSIAGIQCATANFTIANPVIEHPLEIIPVDPPSVAILFSVNTSPLMGQEGKNMTTNILLARLQQEVDNNVSLKLKMTVDPDVFEISGRGEMQLGVLIETIRREGFEISVSPPRVLFQTDENGQLLEPVEEVTIDCPSEFSGSIIDKLSKRKGDLLRMMDHPDGNCRMVFKCPMRGLIGFAPELKNDTKGTGIMAHAFLKYESHKGSITKSRKGCMISMADGEATAFAIGELEARGSLFISPGTKIYSGMVIGECNRSQDLEVNPCKGKVLTNVRCTVRDELVRLVPPIVRPLEELLSYMNDDEMLEVTPKNIRLRKRYLDSSTRKRMKSKANA